MSAGAGGESLCAVEGIGGEKVASSIKAASGIAMDAGGKVGRYRGDIGEI